MKKHIPLLARIDRAIDTRWGALVAQMEQRIIKASGVLILLFLSISLTELFSSQQVVSSPRELKKLEVLSKDIKEFNRALTFARR